MINTSGEINSQSKQDITDRHVAKGKSAPSAHYLAHVIPFIAVCYIPFESHASINTEKSISHSKEKNNHPNIYLHVSCLQAVLVDSLMTIDTQSTDQSAGQQLTTTTHELFTPCSRLELFLGYVGMNDTNNLILRL